MSSVRDMGEQKPSANPQSIEEFMKQEGSKKWTNEELMNKVPESRSKRR